MTSALVDSNILIDLLTADRTWGRWSAEMLGRLAQEATLVVNPITFAEVSVGLDSLEVLDSAFPREYFRRENLPWEAAFLAGKAFLKYRQRGGARRSPLPDFYIGAHAAVRGYRLLTRDPARYRTYFPKLELVAP